MESSKFIEVGRIMETNDLSFFKPSILNRNISKSQINKLKKSIQNFGQQDEIKIKPDGTIIDGHEDYYAIKELNEQENADLMLKYTVIEAEDEINLIITMNSTHQDWGTADYINIYAKNNNKQYQKIIEIAKKYKQTTTSVLSTICFGSDIKRFREKIKNGEVLDFANWAPKFFENPSEKYKSSLGTNSTKVGDLPNVRIRLSALQEEMDKLKNKSSK